MNEIFKLKPFPAASLLCMALSMLSGILFIFIFANDLFFKLSFIQLILLSIVGTAPIVIFNSVFVLLLLIEDKPKEEWSEQEMVKYLSGAMLFGSLAVIPVVYLPIIIFSNIYISFKIALLASLIIEIAILFGIWRMVK